MRIVVGIALALIAACDRQRPNTDDHGSTAGSSSAHTTDVVQPAAPPPAKLDPGALDAALAKKHIAPDAVKKRAATATSAWAIVASKRNQTGDALAYDVVRVRANNDVADLVVTPPSDATLDDVVSLDVRDLDGDGNDDALLVVAWTRAVKQKSSCAGCFMITDETAKQLYVIGGAHLTQAFTHLVVYSSSSEGMPEDNPTPAPEADDVAYDWKVAGTSPTVMLKRTKSTVAAANRLKGAIDPATDPLLSAGTGKDVALNLK